ncbi:uncharacterized protein METZ01_LOCUS121927 [marine metagenome]|uniref:Uncharacterized protein n=1 Tax=marine metagenome TaxID=408172 RepID=A0A381XXW3_9ZZZZ
MGAKAGKNMIMIKPQTKSLSPTTSME